MWSQVNAERIYYVHDGSDSIHDDFSLMAISVTSDKKSNPQTIGVTIDPVNDQVPVVTKNKILDVWTGMSFCDLSEIEFCANELCI